MAKHICFYSNKDKWSAAFLEELKKTPWVSEFRFVCVDPGAQRPQLPSWLKQVPTLVIHGLPEPLVDTQVMNWLYERKLREMPRTSSESTASPVVSGEPMSWNENELGGFGNAGYSYIDSDTSTGGDGGTTIPGAFSFLNGGASPGDRSSEHSLQGQVTTQSNRSKKEQMFDKQMEMYKQQRDTGIQMGPKRQ
jgi:hypothetical protein